MLYFTNFFTYIYSTKLFLIYTVAAVSYYFIILLLFLSLSHHFPRFLLQLAPEIAPLSLSFSSSHSWEESKSVNTSKKNSRTAAKEEDFGWRKKRRDIDKSSSLALKVSTQTIYLDESASTRGVHPVPKSTFRFACVPSSSAGSKPSSLHVSFIFWFLWKWVWALGI